MVYLKTLAITSFLEVAAINPENFLWKNNSNQDRQPALMQAVSS
jgi:hypothetical protein